MDSLKESKLYKSVNDSINTALDNELYQVSNLGGGLNRLAKSQEIEKKKNQFRKPPQLVEISWKTYRIAGFIFFALSFFVMKYIIDHFEKKIEDQELMSILKIVSFFFILNFGTFIFITVYYKYRKSVKGIKGVKGNRGPRGDQGKSDNCNICNIKTGSFRKEIKRPPIKEKVDTSDVVFDFTEPSETWQSIKNYYENGTTSIVVLTPGYLGPPHKNTAKKYTAVENKPIIGVSASFNEVTGELYSISYFYDKNKKHNPHKYKYRPIKYDSEKTVFGRQDKKGTSVDFRAPANSAIYKVEVFHNNLVIQSVRFYCADIKTGYPVKVLDPITGSFQDYATIGKIIKESDTNNIRDSITSNPIVIGKKNTDGTIKRKYIQTFISEVGVYSDDERIYSLGFLSSYVFK